MHFKDIFHFLIGYIAIVVLVNLFDAPHYLYQFVVTAHNIEHLWLRYLLLESFLPVKYSKVAWVVYEIRIVSFIVHIHVLVDFTNSLSILKIEQMLDINFGIHSITIANKSL